MRSALHGPAGARRLLGTLGRMVRSAYFISCVTALALPWWAVADTGYFFGFYRCDRTGDRIVVTSALIYNEEADAVLRKNTPTEVIYATDELTRCFDIDLEQRGLDENRKCESTPIIKHCKLASGHYTVTLDKFGSEPVPYVTISKSGKVVADVVLEQCWPEAPRKGDRIVVQSGKPQILRAPCTLRKYAP